MTLTREAWDRFNQYLQDMRASLSGSAAADVEEIEQDIRDHVGAELSERSSPVSADQLEDVLRRLGSPRQWARDGAAPSAQPQPGGNSFEDWLTYGTAASVVVFLVFPPLLIISWLLARWAMARIEERGEPLGTRRWLLYPPIVIVIAPLVALAVVWAFGPFAELGGKIFNSPAILSSPTRDVIGALAVAFGGLGAYWVVLGAILGVAAQQLRFLLYPFGQGFRRRHGWYLAITGAAVVVVCGATLFSVWR